MSKLDVLFVIPPAATSAIYQSRSKEHANEPPAKARLMCAYLMRRNCSVAVSDASVLGYEPERMAEEVQAADPQLVVVPVYGYNPTSSTQTMPAARMFARAIKDLDPTIPILFTGIHPAALPERTLREEPTDFVCDGEGPITVHQLLQVLKSGGNLRTVQSLWYRDADKNVVHNAPAPLLDLNAEPALPGWVHMDPRNYYANDWHTFYADYADRAPYANPFSEEGCPFKCDFCNIQAPFRTGESLMRIGDTSAPNSYRRLKPELFVEEVTYLVENFGVRHFKIPDEMYALHKGHVLTIAEMIRERFGDSLNFWCYARVDTCKPEFLEPMRAAGFKWICLGIEAANSTVRSGQDKGFADSRIYDVVNEIEAAGISGALNYIFGLPGDTMESMQATYDLAAALNGPFANFYATQALPGSQLHVQATRSGYPLPERTDGPGWIGYSQYSYECEPYYTGNVLTSAQILGFRDRAHEAYYSRPEYRQKLLGDPRFGEVAVRNIETMLSRFPLHRKILGN
jgi:anaerobic magnesium-protoporphyrin IX monomethyl ester cyclase